MSTAKVKIIRNPPTRRDLALSKGIYGLLKIHARTETLLHIGIGGETLSIPSRMIDAAMKIIHVGASRGADVGHIIRELSRLIAQYGLSTKVYSIIKYNNRPVIPGSSLKGAVRSRLELLFRSRNNSVPSCFRVVSSPPRTEPAPKGTHGWRHQRIWPSSLENRGPACSVVGAEYWEDMLVCIVCDMFGAPGLRSKIDFGNLEPVDKANTRVLKLDIGGRLVTFEFIDKNQVFQGQVVLRGIGLEELGLLTVAMKLLSDKPILIGRFKYVGHNVLWNGSSSREWFGRLNLKALELRIPVHASQSIRLLTDECGVKLRKKDFSYIVDGEELSKVLRVAVDKAMEKYGEYLQEVSEVEVIEKELAG